MQGKNIFRKVREAYNENKRLVAPLMGFPGLNMTNASVKLAQQNYGEHYKALKALVKTYSPDAIFPLMDLSVEANALGMYTIFPQKESATVLKEDRFDIEQLSELKKINISYDTRLIGYVETIKLLRIAFPEQLLKGAYVTGPYSLAGLIMGADETAMATVLEQDKLTKLCEFATEIIEEYTRLLIGAGAQIICFLEPTAVMLGPDEFEKFSSRYIKHINASYQYTDVSMVYHTCGNTMHLIDKMVDSKVDALSLDSFDAGVDLPDVAKNIQDKNVMIMGNINPTGNIFNGTPESVEKEVNDLLQAMDFYPNFILSTGCDLPQEVPLKNIEAFMNAGRNYQIGK